MAYSEEININENQIESHTEAIPHQEEHVSHEHTIYAEKIFSIGNFNVTNAMLSSWLAVFLIIVFSFVIRIKLKKVPGKLQNVFEIIIGGAMSLVDQVTNDKKITNKIFPLVFSIFIFILINNWLGILPFVGSMGFNMREEGHLVFVPLFRGGTADLNTTLTLAIVSVIGSNIFAIFTLGIWKTLNKYVKIQELGSIFTKIRKDPSIIVVAPISFFIGLIEIIGEVAKIASLSFRLFGNIFAGEVLLSSMAAIFAFLLPTPFLFLEVFVGLIQALIFSLLSTVYFTIAAQDHDEHDEHSHKKEENKMEEEKDLVAQIS